MTVSNPTRAANQSEIVTIDRRRGDRRGTSAETNPTSVPPKKQRRRHIDPTTCERDYNGDEIEFMTAMDEYKRASGRMFPTCSEILEVVFQLGYRQVAEPGTPYQMGQEENDNDPESLDALEEEMETA